MVELGAHQACNRDSAGQTSLSWGGTPSALQVQEAWLLRAPKTSLWYEPTVIVDAGDSQVRHLVVT